MSVLYAACTGLVGPGVDNNPTQLDGSGEVVDRQEHRGEQDTDAHAKEDNHQRLDEAHEGIYGVRDLTLIELREGVEDMTELTRLLPYLDHGDHDTGNLGVPSECVGDGGAAFHICYDIPENGLIDGVPYHRPRNLKSLNHRHAGHEHRREGISDAGQIELLVEVAEIGYRELQTIEGELATLGFLEAPEVEAARHQPDQDEDAVGDKEV